MEKRLEKEETRIIKIEKDQVESNECLIRADLEQNNIHNDVEYMEPSNKILCQKNSHFETHKLSQTLQ